MDKTNWIPISHAPKEDRYGTQVVCFERGTVLLHINGSLRLLGDDIAGFRTQGCECCSSEWEECLTWYTHFLPPQFVLPDWLYKIKGKV